MGVLLVETTGHFITDKALLLFGVRELFLAIISNTNSIPTWISTHHLLGARRFSPCSIMLPHGQVVNIGPKVSNSVLFECEPLEDSYLPKSPAKGSEEGSSQVGNSSEDIPKQPTPATGNISTAPQAPSPVHEPEALHLDQPPRQQSEPPSRFAFVCYGAR